MSSDYETKEVFFIFVKDLIEEYILECKIIKFTEKTIKSYHNMFTTEQIAKLNDVSRISVHRYLQHIEQDLETATATELIAKYNKLIEERETEKKK